MTVEFKESKIKGRWGVFTPYNGDFVKALKANVPSAKWNGEGWFFDEISKADVEKLVETFFPSHDALDTVVIEWDLNRDNPQIDGTSLATVERDYWNWKKNCPVEFRVVESEISSGGSRKNPGLYGRLVIEAKIRPGANFSPEPLQVEVVENGDVPNPLAEFLTEDLVAELKRRGELS